MPLTALLTRAKPTPHAHTGGRRAPEITISRLPSWAESRDGPAVPQDGAWQFRQLATPPMVFNRTEDFGPPAVQGLAIATEIAPRHGSQELSAKV